jgi:hypothetical protein
VVPLPPKALNDERIAFVGGIVVHSCCLYCAKSQVGMLWHALACFAGYKGFFWAQMIGPDKNFFQPGFKEFKQEFCCKEI